MVAHSYDKYQWTERIVPTSQVAMTNKLIHIKHLKKCLARNKHYTNVSYYYFNFVNWINGIIVRENTGITGSGNKVRKHAAY